MGVNGNLPNIVSKRLQARVENEKSLDLPSNAVLCDIEFEFKQQSFHYDDQAFLVLGGYYIFATQLKSEYREGDGALLRYDWQKLRGMPWEPGLHQPVCMGMDQGGTCLLPPSDQSGNFDISIPRKVSTELSHKLIGQEDYSFRLIGAGEGTPGTDCHIKQSLSFDVKIRYFPLED